MHFQKENDYFGIGSWVWLLHARKYFTNNTHEIFAEFYISFLRDSIHARFLHHICFIDEMKRHGNESNENMAFRRDDLHMQTSPCQNHFKV